jgi:hypothetical protein
MVTTLKLDSVWDPLRKDPRFQKLVATEAPKTDIRLLLISSLPDRRAI